MKKIKMVIGRQSVTGVNTLNVIVQSSTADENERGLIPFSHTDFAAFCFLKNA